MNICRSYDSSYRILDSNNCASLSKREWFKFRVILLLFTYDTSTESFIDDYPYRIDWRDRIYPWLALKDDSDDSIWKGEGEPQNEMFQKTVCLWRTDFWPTNLMRLAVTPPWLHSEAVCGRCEENDRLSNGLHIDNIDKQLLSTSQTKPTRVNQ